MRYELSGPELTPLPVSLRSVLANGDRPWKVAQHRHSLIGSARSTQPPTIWYDGEVQRMLATIRTGQRSPEPSTAPIRVTPHLRVGSAAQAIGFRLIVRAA